MSALANRLQLEGPDEFPRGFYEHVADSTVPDSRKGLSSIDQAFADAKFHTMRKRLKRNYYTELRLMTTALGRAEWLARG